MPEEIKKKLEDTADKLEEAFNEGVQALDGWKSGDSADLAKLGSRIQTLSDHLDNRLRKIPKDAKEVRMSRTQAATLVQVLNNWAQAIGDLADEVESMACTAEESKAKLESESANFGTYRAALFAALEKVAEKTKDSVPELDLESPLKDAERSLP